MEISKECPVCNKKTEVRVNFSSFMLNQIYSCKNCNSGVKLNLRTRYLPLFYLSVIIFSGIVYFPLGFGQSNVGLNKSTTN